MNRRLLAFAVIASGLLLSACSGGSSSMDGDASQGAPSAIVTPEASSSAPVAASIAASPGYEALISDGKITTAQICDDYLITLEKFIATADSQITNGTKYVDDAYAAAKFVSDVAWVDADQEERLLEILRKSATSALNIVTDGQAGQVESVDEYVSDSMAACGLSSELESAKTKAVEVNALATALYAESENKPWYPRGYDEWVDGVAFKFNKSETNNSYLWGWAYNVVTRDGCPDGLYVEVNFESSSGTVLDWGNDSLSALKPGQRGLMEFRVGTDRDGVDTFDVTEVNCR